MAKKASGPEPAGRGRSKGRGASPPRPAEPQPQAEPADPFVSDFGPGVAEEPAPAGGRAVGPIPGIACAGDGCLLKPVADLVGRFAFSASLRHGASLSRAAFSGLELMRALRDFLDEEIALAERAGKGEGATRFVKIPVE